MPDLLLSKGVCITIRAEWTEDAKGSAVHSAPFQLASRTLRLRGPIKTSGQAFSGPTDRLYETLKIALHLRRIGRVNGVLP